MNLGDEWLMGNRGFSICRALAMQFPDHCRAVHTANPAFEKPSRKKGVGAWMKYRVAKMTKGKWPALSFGYLPTELQERVKDNDEVETHGSMYSDRPHGLTLHRLYSLRPQTLSFSLCDSPVGLLAALLDVIHTRVPSGSPLTSRSQSPFLSPVELEMEMQGANQNQNLGRLDPIVERASEDDDSRNAEMDRDKRKYTWTPTDILNWVMMQWLPGEWMFLVLYRYLRPAYKLCSALVSPSCSKSGSEVSWLICFAFIVVSHLVNPNTYVDQVLNPHCGGYVRRTSILQRLGGTRTAPYLLE
jgi:hypothetical protein